MPVNRFRRNGSFVPLSVNYPDDDKIIAAGERAEVLWTRGLAFCGRTLSDGFISDNQLERLHLAGVKTRAKRLVEVGLWERVDNRDALFSGECGYRVVRWGKWNLTLEEIQSKQAADAERKAKARTKP